jgi:hypothetical protein
MSRYDDDPAERDRVYGKIAPLVMAFYRENTGKAFHADDLLEYVLEHEPYTAPDSPGRILRQLRIERKLDYNVINRPESLYLFRSIRNYPRQKDSDDE